MILYHGSEQIVKEPKYGVGNKRNDYGQGFYLTKEKELAKEWSCEENRDGYINKYEIGDFLTKVLEVTYAIAEDNKRKASVDKYKKMAERHSKLFKRSRLVQWLYTRNWGKKLLFIFLGIFTKVTRCLQNTNYIFTFVLLQLCFVCILNLFTFVGSKRYICFYHLLWILLN